jgi:hypothetical protein
MVRHVGRERAFVVDPERVVHETIDGETILINLDEGTYHSLSGSGPEVWALLTAGASEGEIVRLLCERHGADEPAVAPEIRRVLGELELQGLIAPGEPERVGDAPAASNGFVPPVLQSFTDMQYLLLLDPIHDFQSSDWPSQSADRADGAAA